MLLTRGQFLFTLAAATIDFSFPGEVFVAAQRLNESSPFVSHHAADALPSASTIKLLIAVSLTQRLGGQGASFDDSRTLTAADIVAASETFGSAKPGDKVTFAALLNAMISQSDNTAANVLARYIGLDALNYDAAKLGLPSTRMGRFFMDFKARAAGRDNYTSAADMVRLARMIGNDPVTYQRTLGAMLSQEDRALIPAAISRRVLIANKTGTLPDVRHDVAIVGFGTASVYAAAILTRAPSANDPVMLRYRSMTSAQWMPQAEARIREIAKSVDARFDTSA